MKSDERTLSLVRDTTAFPDLPGTKDTMSADPPGKIKGDGSGKSASDIPGDDPSNYTGCLPGLYEFKMKVKAWYLTDFIQLVVAAVIFANFIVVMFSVTQFVLDNKEVEDFLDVLDKVFIYFFLVELAINMFTSAQGVDQPALITPWVWSWEFWVGDNWSWNWFDFIVIITPIALEGASWASSIRILRLFRVIRVLKSIAKFEALQVVASSVSKSVGGIGAVAVMIFGLMCCYAIVGVIYFGRKEFHNACEKISEPGSHQIRLQPPYFAAGTTVEYCTSTKCRGGNVIPTGDTGLIVDYDVWAKQEGFYNTISGAACEDYGALYDCFANLRRALYTTFMMMTLESWPDLCWASVSVYKFGAIYFVSFVAINALMMANLIIAVFTTRMDKVADEVAADAKAWTEKRRQMSAAVFSSMGENATVQGVDLDGDGIADEFIIDADGDGIADAVVSKEEMAQVWTVGEPIEVYSHTIMQWCSGQVKEVNHKEKRIKVEYDVDGNTLGEKTIPFKHDSIRRPAGAAIGGSAIQVKAGKHTVIGATGQGVENASGLENLIRQLSNKLDAVAKQVNTLVNEKSQKGKKKRP